MGSSIKYVRAKGGGSGGGGLAKSVRLLFKSRNHVLSKSVHGGSGIGLKIYVFERTYFMDDPYRYKVHIFLKKICDCFLLHGSSKLFLNKG